MTRNPTSLILFVALVVGFLIVPSMVQARSRTGSDLGTRVAALEAQQAINTANIATNTANIATNTANIATNTANIATNTANIATNTTNIGVNATGITANAAALVTHMSSGDHDDRYVRDTGEDLRVMRGSGNGAGVLTAGTGFTVAKLFTGGYRITYNTPFIGNPGVVAMRGNGGSTAFTAAGTTGFTLLTLDSAGALVDSAFDFIVIGRQ